MFHHHPSLDLSGARPLPPAQPAILRAVCTHPQHPCHGQQQKALRHCVPLLVTHLGAVMSTLRLYTNRPWELTSGTRLALLTMFELYAEQGDLVTGSRARVHLSQAEFVIPTDLVESFTADLLACVQFARMPS